MKFLDERPFSFGTQIAIRHSRAMIVQNAGLKNLAFCKNIRDVLGLLYTIRPSSYKIRFFVWMSRQRTRANRHCSEVREGVDAGVGPPRVTNSRNQRTLHA